MKAIYSLHISGEFCCRIPKKRGEGFLKSAFGGHHVNEESRKFDNLIIELNSYSRGIVDVDGYLAIEQDNRLFGEERKKDAEIIKKALTIIFTRVTEWEEVDFLVVARS